MSEAPDRVVADLELSCLEDFQNFTNSVRMRRAQKKNNPATRKPK
jgi:hypothetical protein